MGCPVCMPLVPPFPKPGEVLLLPGSLSSEPLSLAHDATPGPCGKSKVRLSREMSRIAPLLSLWSLFLVHFISGSEVPWEGCVLPLVFHWM